MQLLIKKCSDSLLWYRDFVGQKFQLLWEDDEGYWSREPAGHYNVVRREDAEVLTNEI